jgi:WD40 repeat protein
MRLILTRVLLTFLTLGLVACFQYPVDFGDPSVLRGALSGKINSGCQVHVYQIAWSSDGKKFATIDNRTGGRLTIWDNDTGAELSFVDYLELNSGVQTMTWTSDNKYVVYSAYINQHSTVFTYNTQTGVAESSLILEDEQNYWISHISLSGHRVLGYLSVLNQNTGNPIGINMRVWDSATGKKVFSKFFDLTRSASFALSKNGEEFAIWVNGTVQIWSIASGLKTQEWKIVGDFVRDLTYNVDGLSLSALVGFDGVELAQFVRFNKSSPEAVLQTKVKSVAALRFNGDGTYASVVTVNLNNQYVNRLINLETGVFSELPADSGYIDIQWFSPDGKTLLFAGVGSCAIQRLTIASDKCCLAGQKSVFNCW